MWGRNGQGNFSGRGRIVHSETRPGQNTLRLDVIYYYEGPLSGTLTYHGDLEEVKIDPATSKGTYQLLGRFDGSLGRHAARLLVEDQGRVDLTTQPHPTWTGMWKVKDFDPTQRRRNKAQGTVHGEVIFSTDTDFTVQGVYRIESR